MRKEIFGWWKKPRIEKSREGTRGGWRTARSSLRTAGIWGLWEGSGREVQEDLKGSFALDTFVGVNPEIACSRGKISGKGVFFF